MDGWKALLYEPAKTIIAEVGHLLVNVLVVVLILLAGWIISRVIKVAVTRGLRGVKLDTLSDKVGMDGLLAKGGIKYSLSELMGVSFLLALDVGNADAGDQRRRTNGGG